MQSRSCFRGIARPRYLLHLPAPCDEECLDHIMVFNEAYLRHILKAYFPMRSVADIFRDSAGSDITEFRCAYGAAVALLIAGSSVNLPSLLTITRSTNWKVAIMVAASIWTLAVVSGTFVS